MKALSFSRKAQSFLLQYCRKRNGTSIARPVLICPTKPYAEKRLEAVPHANLYLTRVSKAVADRSVEVKEQ
jgi:hypothetical protein